MFRWHVVTGLVPTITIASVVTWIITMALVVTYMGRTILKQASSRIERNMLAARRAIAGIIEAMSFRAPMPCRPIGEYTVWERDTDRNVALWKGVTDEVFVWERDESCGNGTNQGVMWARGRRRKSEGRGQILD